jgi:uncharacterized membrane protein
MKKKNWYEDEKDLMNGRLFNYICLIIGVALLIIGSKFYGTGDISYWKAAPIVVFGTLILYALLGANWIKAEYWKKKYKNLKKKND